MRIIGLDWGEARIGVAVSDPLGITAQALCTLENNDKFIGKLKVLIGQYGAAEIVIGLPKNMKGEAGVAAEKTMSFYNEISSLIPLKITLWDERLSTKMAQRYLEVSGASRKKQKSFIDAATAGIILQGYMDSKKT